MAQTRQLVVASQNGLETSKPGLMTSVSIRVKEDQHVVRKQSSLLSAFCPFRFTSVPEVEQAYFLSLATTDKNIIAFTQMWDLSARTLADTIREYIEEEGLMEAVLYWVDLSKNPHMSCKSLGKTLELLSEFQIQGLDLSCNPQLGDNLVAKIQPLLHAKKSHFTELKLAECGFTLPGLKWLVKVASTSNLRLLDISHIRINNESELLERVLEFPMIEDLGFGFCDLSPADVHTIAESLPFTCVKSLNLSGNRFGSKGLVHLASTLPETMVERLNLKQVGIEAECEGLTELARAWVKRPFPTLNLQMNPMGQDEVMKFIAVLQELRPSETVDETFLGNVEIRCC